MECWVRDRDATLFGCEQDEDLMLGTPENVPLMCEYLDRRDIPMERRTEIVSAMAEMLMLERGDECVTDELAEVLKAALLRNRDAVEESYHGVVGGFAGLMLRRLLGQPTFSYEQGHDSTSLVASPTPGRDEWASFIDEALADLESSDGVVFPAGHTHFRGIFAHGIRARYRDREFSLWCDSPGKLTLKHEDLRPSHRHGLLFGLECLYAFRQR
jgi:hypothetical protein